MFNVRLAGGHLCGKQLFTWLSLVVSLMASFVLSFFPLDVLDEIWDLIESVSEGFLTYSYSFCDSVNRIVFRAQPVFSTYCIIQFSKFHVRTMTKTVIKVFMCFATLSYDRGLSSCKKHSDLKLV